MNFQYVVWQNEIWTYAKNEKHRRKTLDAIQPFVCSIQICCTLIKAYAMCIHKEHKTSIKFTQHIKESGLV